MNRIHVAASHKSKIHNLKFFNLARLLKIVASTTTAESIRDGMGLRTVAHTVLQ